MFAALGSPAVKLMRFPPLSSSINPAKDHPIQILKRRLFIPSSSYTRGLHFLVAAHADGSSRAVFALGAAPECELPAVILGFKIDASDWKTYDPNEKDENSVARNTLGFLKGAYAAKDQAFSVPIRSGLDWRRSVYVTCW